MLAIDSRHPRPRAKSLVVESLVLAVLIGNAAPVASAQPAGAAKETTPNARQPDETRLTARPGSTHSAIHCRRALGCGSVPCGFALPRA